ncbi:MAG: hypothetical protein Q8T08_23110 [Ignavibacteria bacterium]|nr:hypothetical protein [Ignavibacteria bacterium]
MLDQIMGILKSEVGSQVIKETNVGTDKLDAIFSVIGDVASKEVAGKMLGGDLSSVMNLFSNKSNNSSANSLQNSISTGVVSNLISKLGLSEGIAKTIASLAVPALIGLITKKNSETPDDDASPLTELFGGSGGVGGAVGNILGKLF